MTRRINEGKDPKAPSTDQGSRRSTKEVVELDPAVREAAIAHRQGLAFVRCIWCYHILFNTV